MQTRYYRFLTLTFILVALVGFWKIGSPGFSLSFLPSADALLIATVIIDLGILLLIVFEDFGKPYFLDLSR